MPVIFSSLVHATMDRPLFPQWVKHLLKFGFDKYIVGVHPGEFPSKKDEADAKDTADFFSFYGFETSIVNGSFIDGALRHSFMSHVAGNLRDSDHLVTLDSDEWIAKEDASETEDLAKTIADSDYTTATLIDRYDIPMKNVNPDVPVQEQFPRREALFTSDDFPHIFREKVLSSRACFDVNFCGSHFFREYGCNHQRVVADSAWKHGGHFSIEHFRWRKSAFIRSLTRSYYSPGAIEAMMNYFRVDWNDPEYEQVKRKIVRMQTARGWGLNPKGETVLFHPDAVEKARRELKREMVTP